MHPNRSFRIEDQSAMAEIIESIGFGMVFAATPNGLRVAHVPVVIEGGKLLFHLARGNALTKHLDGADALYVTNGPDAYVSPDWYGEPDQVPTWNYITVEVEGIVTKLDEDGLVEQVDKLTALQEGRLDKKPWTRDKMSEGVFDKTLRGITGFALDIKGWRGTAKLNQNKPDKVREAAADAIESNGRPAIAHWMRNLDL